VGDRSVAAQRFVTIVVATEFTWRDRNAVIDARIEALPVDFVVCTAASIARNAAATQAAFVVLVRLRRGVVFIATTAENECANTCDNVTAAACKWWFN